MVSVIGNEGMMIRSTSLFGLMLMLICIINTDCRLVLKDGFAATRSVFDE